MAMCSKISVTKEFHGLAGNSHIGISLLQHLYIDHIAFLSLSLSPLGSRSHPGLSLAVVVFFFVFLRGS